MCNHDNAFRNQLTSTTKLFQAFHICPELGFGLGVGVPWLFALALPLALAFTLAKTSLKQVKKESFSASLSRFTGKFAKLKKVLHRLYLGETAEGGTGRVDSSKSPARCTCRNTFQMLDAAISSFWASEWSNSKLDDISELSPRIYQPRKLWLVFCTSVWGVSLRISTFVGMGLQTETTEPLRHLLDPVKIKKNETHEITYR